MIIYYHYISIIDFLFCFAEVKLLRFSSLSQIDEGLEKRERSTAVLDALCEKSFRVTAPVVHLAVSCDERTLSVVTSGGGGLQCLFYDLGCFASQVSRIIMIIQGLIRAEAPHL
jgi:hypothetical protein